MMVSKQVLFLVAKLTGGSSVFVQLNCGVDCLAPCDEVTPQGICSDTDTHMHSYKCRGYHFTCVAYPIETTANNSDSGMSSKRPSRRAARNISRQAYTCDDEMEFTKEEISEISPEASSPRRGPGRRKRKRVPSMRIKLLGRNEGTNSPIFSAETFDVSIMV